MLNEEKRKNKGEILFAEYPLNKSRILVISTLILILLFLIMFLSFYFISLEFPPSERITEVPSTDALFSSLFITVFTGVFLLIVIGFFSTPIRIYKNGFDKPSSFLFNKGENRFVPFDKVKSIRLVYQSNLGLLQENGIEFTTEDENTIAINILKDFEELIAIKKALKFALKERWDELYEDNPKVIGLFGERDRKEKRKIFEKANGLSNQEFRKIKNKIERNLQLVFALSGFFTIVVSIWFLLAWALSPYPYLIIPFLGVLLIILSMVCQYKTNKRLEFIKRVVGIEKKTGKKILPDDIEKIDGGFSNLVFIDEPNFSQKKWKRIIKSTKFFDLRYILFLMFLMIILVFGTLFLSILLDTVLTFNNPIISYLPFLGFAWFIYFITIAYYNNIYGSIIEYQNLTSKIVIPEDLRSEIYRGWKLKKLSTND